MRKLIPLFFCLLLFGQFQKKAQGATRISAATGNFTAAGTWKAVSAVANAEVDSEAGTINVSTSNLDSTAFTLAATNADGICTKIQQVITPTGTLSVTLRNNTAPGTRDFTVTINASDLGSTANGWYCFTAAAVAPNGTDSYGLRVVRSVADGASNRITLYATSSTAATMNRSVRLVTTGAPAVNEKIIIAGEYTGAGASTSYTVTNDNTATTSFGPTVSGGPPQGLTINSKSTFQFGTAASAFYLKVKGVCQCNPGATFDVGTGLSSSGSATVFMDSAANVDSGWNFASACTATGLGATKTVKTLLTGDVSAAGTVLTLGSTTGWVAGDVLAIAATTRTASQSENKTILTVDSPTQVTLTAGVTNAHSGTSPTQAEVINLTRNVVFTGASATLQGYVLSGATAVVTLKHMEFNNLGSNTATKEGVSVATTSGTFDFENNSLHNFTVAQSIGVKLSGVMAGTVSVLNNSMYSIDRACVAVSGSGVWTVTGNVCILTVQNGGNGALDFTGSASAGILNSNTAVSGAGPGFDFNWGATTTLSASGNTSHSNAGVNFQFRGANVTQSSAVLGSTTSWRSNSSGLLITATGPNVFTLNVCSFFGNTTNNISVTTQVYGLSLSGCTLNGDTTFSTGTGLSISTDNTSPQVSIVNSTFSVATGILTAHTTTDIAHGSGTKQVFQIYGNFVKLSATTPISNLTSLNPWSFIRITGWNQAANTHRSYLPYGQLDTDTVIVNVGTPSERLTPNNASSKLESGQRCVAVSTGHTATFTVMVRKSISTDPSGANYNGAQPRLVLKQNYQAGILTDTVLATMVTGSLGVWEKLTGVTTPAVTDKGVLCVVVDGDGTAGWVNDDDWTEAGGQSTLVPQFWLAGEPAAYVFSGGGGNSAGAR